MRSEGRIQNLQQLADLVVRVDGMKIYRLADVADLAVGHLARYGAVTRDLEGSVDVQAAKEFDGGPVFSGIAPPGW